MLQAVVRKLVGADRGTDHDHEIADANAKLDKARRALDAETGKVATAESEVSEAQQAFDLDASEANADRILDAKRKRDRAQLFAERASKAVDAAAEALGAAERERDEHLLADASSRCDPGTIEKQLEELISSRAPSFITNAIELIDGATSIEGKGREALREKLALEQRLGRDTRATEAAIATESMGGVATAVLTPARLARRVAGLVQRIPGASPKLRWLGDI